MSPRRAARPLAVLSLLGVTLLAACSPAPPAPTASPSASASATPSPVPTPDTETLLAGLVDFASGSTSYHIDIEGDLNLRPLTGKVVGTVDASGSDSASDVTLSMAGVDVRVEAIVLGDRAYARIAGGEWQTMNASALDEQANPLSAILAATDVRAQGSFVRDGEPRYRLRLLDALAFDPSTMTSGVTDVLIRAQSLDVEVDAEGIPSRATFTLDGTARIPGGRSVPMFIDITYTFSGIGEPVTIEAPI